ncbi:UDP-glucose 4-epimerase family protein [Idiomarina baltica]|uniref:UDP-galactose 4-epimerase, putative n=1 Tax=Idiomarina baltica OS145 TaxID=314276 RepID=A0ABM9WLQ3_9GAMM|nr:SDR family oxidoreductase [Idiomarina baltica]EAQ31914.1 UDP-galactose 4-epimerase, putative [Idiomarina baltica OS145]
MLNSPDTIAVTGVTGFVGGQLTQYLIAENLKVLSLGRTPSDLEAEHVYLDFNDDNFDASEEFSKSSQVIHCAARAHVMDESEANPLDTYLKANTYSTLRLAEQAAAAGVKRFIYLSSIKALGESTSLGSPFSHESPLAPEDDYGVSKARAEEGLQDIAERTGMEVTIIRPPLVYGKGVKANFAAMMSLAKKNLPLPLGSIKNKRSMVALDNLVDLIVTCIDHENAGNRTFMVSDDRDVSTTELLQAMTRAHGKTPRLIPCPPSLIRLAATTLGKKAVAERLLGSLQVDIEYTKEQLNWTPKVKMEDVLTEMVND